MASKKKKPEKDVLSEAILPAWVDELALVRKSDIANVFIVEADMNSFTVNPDVEEPGEPRYIPLKTSLPKMVDGCVVKGGVRIFYSLSAGLYFLSKEERDRFRQMAGLDKGKDKDKDDKKTAGSAPVDPIIDAINRAQIEELPKDPSACLELIERCLRLYSNVAVIIQSVDLIVPAAGGGGALSINDRSHLDRLARLANSGEIKQKGNVVFLVTDQLGKISQDLRRSSAHTVRVLKPNKEERLDFIRWRMEELSDVKLVGFTLSEFVVATQGMSFKQINDIFLYAGQKGNKLSLADIKKKKTEILNEEYGDILEVVDPVMGLENIGGLEYVKEYLEEVLVFIRKGQKSLVPMGALFSGPPGTGKTALVEALAKEAGFNFVKIKNVRSMWVGESEARMEKLIGALRAMAPVVVMNDEADLAEAGRDEPKGDSGVSARIMKMWMELLSDDRIQGDIVVISCTNRPDHLDPALKRSGRTDDRFLLPMPSAEERKKIFRVMFMRHSFTTSITDFTPFAELTDGLSGANIRDIVSKSGQLAAKLNKTSVDEEALRGAIADFIPTNNQKDNDFMTMIGLLECSSRRRLPPHIKEILAGIFVRNLVPNLSEMIKAIEERKIVDISDIKHLAVGTISGSPPVNVN